MAALQLHAAVLLLCAGAASGMTGHPMPLDGFPSAGVAEDGVNAWTVGSQWGLKNGGRVYMVKDAKATDWWHAGFLRFDLRGKTLSYTADLRGVPCGCVATIYFVAMGDPNPGAPYCDIQPGRGWSPCFELDVMESNSHAFHSSLHAQQGTANDGTCNARIGCVGNVGRYPFTTSGVKTSELYGPGAKIDSTKPFQVEAVFDDRGSMSVHLEQDGNTVPVFNKSIAGNVPSHDPWKWQAYPKPGGVPDQAIQATSSAFEGGLVLVSTLWSGDTHWLDKSACGGQQWCNMANAWFTITNFQVKTNPSTATTTTTTTMTTTSSATTTTTTTMTTTSSATTSTNTNTTTTVTTTATTVTTTISSTTTATSTNTTTLATTATSTTATTLAPTPAPTPAPVPTTTPAPTLASTLAPTNSTTAATTLAPAPAPAPAPTSSPTTPAPTPAPTPGPTNSTSLTTTPAPTPAPSPARRKSSSETTTPAPTPAATTPAPTLSTTPANKTDSTTETTLQPKPVPTPEPTPEPMQAPLPTLRLEDDGGRQPSFSSHQPLASGHAAVAMAGALAAFLAVGLLARRRSLATRRAPRPLEEEDAVEGLLAEGGAREEGA